MNKLKQTLEKVLKTESSFVDSESGELNYIKVKDSADSIDEKLIMILADNKDLKNKFFIKIKDVYVFNIKDFKSFLDESKVDNSYTQYANKIGLSDNSGLIENRSEVVLDFPFKDCVLEGGQSTEEGTDTYFEHSDKTGKYEEKTAKRNEIFFNQVLAHDEIDRLYDRKALVNWKRFTKDSKKDGEAVKEIKRDKTGLMQENLIIKGNNLLALHSLKSEFAGKVKLIYIDPPFNTESDEFKYNDNFTHSAWLTFMKNRYEIAKEWLADNGVIAVTLGHEESDYNKVLMDEIFGRENFLNHVVNSTNGPSGFKATSSKIFSTANHLYIYAKDIVKVKTKKLYIEKIYDGNYKYVIDNPQEPYKEWRFSTILENLVKESGYENAKEYKKNTHSAQIFEDSDEFANLNKERVFRTAAIGGGAYKKRKETIELSKNNKGIIFQHPNEDVKNFFILNGEGIVFWKNLYRDIDGKNVPTQAVTDVWTDISWTGIANEGGVTLKNGKKPEKLLKRIIDLTTEKEDLVLDYHAGSGTTCAVAHKMGRQWIGIEQLDYNEGNPETRLINVVSGDKTGISNIVGWKGGGTFIYCELAKWNEKAKEEIQNAKDLPFLVKLFDTLYERYFLNYNVKIKDFKEKIVKEENFKNLTLPQQKKMFLTMLDLNQMYVNESEIADKKYGISAEDQKLTKAFYGKK